MNIAEREQQMRAHQIPEFPARFGMSNCELCLRIQVVTTVKAILEAALEEEVKAALAAMSGEKPRRSGFFERTVDTQYGRIEDLLVPKLRSCNKDRQWLILQRYQRALTGLLDWVGYLYVIGLSLRD